jgi:hypothetical protein
MNKRTPVFLLAALALTACTPEPEVTEPDVAPVTEETRSQPGRTQYQADELLRRADLRQPASGVE